MGTDKAFVPLLGRPLIEHILAKVADLGQAETILVANRPADYAHLGLPLYTDVLPDKGSLGGTVFLPFHFVEAAANLLTLDGVDKRAKIPDFKMAAVQLRKTTPLACPGVDVPLAERGAIKEPTRYVH
jgi:hypothetical protein